MGTWVPVAGFPLNKTIKEGLREPGFPYLHLDHIHKLEY